MWFNLILKNSIYMSILPGCMPSACGGQKKVPDSLDLKLDSCKL